MHAASAAAGERRRHQAAGLPFSPGDAWRVQRRVESAAAATAATAAGFVDEEPVGEEGGVLKSAAVFALWATPAMRRSHAPPRREHEFDLSTALRDPARNSLDVKAHAPPPAATDAKFDAWMRARFGVGEQARASK